MIVAAPSIVKVGKIIDPDYLKCVPLKQLLENRPANSTKPIDSHPDDFLSAHVFSSLI